MRAGVPWARGAIRAGGLGAEFALPALALLLFMGFGEYSRKARVVGFLAPSQGMVKVLATQAGTVIEKRVNEGQQVKQGDVLFVLANIGRRWGINPEEALRRSNAKFSRRFQAIEEAMKGEGRSMHDATLREMEDAYQAAKRREPKPNG